MSWKKAVFYGGAVLVLAACSDATAPSALTKVNGVSASSKSTTTATSDSTTTVAPPTAPLSCGNAVIHVGADGEVSLICLPPVMW